ncbi:exocyst complex component Sec10-like protein [Artemisia annua]|uniref:Exocyst complex component Sec10-like protein n=1 Tax=Artemisia annua TaxID=35608 RepID=A0A2U1ME18_ARTAN|nr:exocyst complex component Sec10-like protein [Artemisia annua]
MAAAMSSAENSACQGLHQCSEIVISEAERLLTAEQKATDYRTVDDSLMAYHRPTTAFTRVLAYLSHVLESAYTAVEGLSTELGIQFRCSVFCPFFRFAGFHIVNWFSSIWAQTSTISISGILFSFNAEIDYFAQKTQRYWTSRNEAKGSDTVSIIHAVANLQSGFPFILYEELQMYIDTLKLLTIFIAHIQPRTGVGLKSDSFFFVGGKANIGFFFLTSEAPLSTCVWKNIDSSFYKASFFKAPFSLSFHISPIPHTHKVLNSPPVALIQFVMFS